VRTIDWDDGAVVIIDQTALPHEERMLRLTTVDELVQAINLLAVRGAMALGVAGAMGVALAAHSAERSGVDADVDAAVDAAAAALVEARPTAVNLGWGVRTALAARAGGAPALLAAALQVRDLDIAANLEIGRRSAGVLAGTSRILTHCNAGALAGSEWGTALSAIVQLHSRSPLEMVYTCETRPLMQGSRLTAWELGRADIPHRVIVDSASSGIILRRQRRHGQQGRHAGARARGEAARHPLRRRCPRGDHRSGDAIRRPHPDRGARRARGARPRRQPGRRAREPRLQPGL